MDGLRELAVASFQFYNKFRGPFPKAEENKLQTFRIRISPNGKPEITDIFVSEGSLPPTPDGPDSRPYFAPGKQPHAKLQMTVITRSHEEVIGTSKQNFLRLFESYDLDPSTLNHIRQNFYGFHSSLTPYNGAYTLFIGTVPFTIVFSFNPTTLSTSAIFLPRVHNGLTSGQQFVQEFTQILQQYADRIDIPSILVLIALVNLGQWQNSVLYKLLQMIRSAEDVSGYGPSGRDCKRVDIDDLLGVQWKIGEIIVRLANVDRHHDIAQSLFDYLGSNLGPAQSTLGVRDQLDIASKEGLDDVVSVLRQQFTGANSTAKYLRERTECHSAVASGLLTHEDALISMEQNSSMKTIAVVTMAFLPGTFFATLFAVPSLQWDQSPVIQSTFWIYWVFTLPFTAIVMGMWYFSTRDWRQQIRDAKRNFLSALPNRRQKRGQV